MTIRKKKPTKVPVPKKFYTRLKFFSFQLLLTQTHHCRISIRCGTHFNDLQEIEVVDLHEPSGWLLIPLKDIQERPIRTYMVQIAVLSNHQNGRDTHMRQIKIHSPVVNTVVAVECVGAFTSPIFKRYGVIR